MDILLVEVIYMAKVLVTLPDEFLSEVDGVAKEEHRSRSELIREALRRYLDATRQSRRIPGEDPKVMRAWREMTQFRERLERSGKKFDSVPVIRRFRGKI